jgi:hypothetical protein
MGGVLVAYFLFWIVVGGLIGSAIGRGKGRATEGFWLGALLGFIGWIIVAVMEPTDEVRVARQAETISLATGMTMAGPQRAPTTTRPCPWCAEDIKAAAIVCRYCGRDVEPVEVGAEQRPQPPRESETVTRIRQLLDERGIAAPGAAEALDGHVSGTLDGVARIGLDGDEGIIAVAGRNGTIWWKARNQIESVDLKELEGVDREGRVVTLRRTGGEAIVVLASDDTYAKGWLQHLRRL